MEKEIVEQEKDTTIFIRKVPVIFSETEEDDEQTPKEE